MFIFLQLYKYLAAYKLILFEVSSTKHMLTSIRKTIRNNKNCTTGKQYFN